MITGASKGMGDEVATLVAKDGFDVILTARQTDKLEKHAHVLRRACNVAVEVMLADLDDPEKAEALWARASKNRQIGVLLNNAGLGRNGTFADLEGWPLKAASISVNIVAATILMKRAAEHMKAQCTGAHPERGLHRRVSVVAKHGCLSRHQSLSC